MVTVTVWPGDNPFSVMENRPNGKVTPEGGAGERLPTETAVKLDKAPELVWGHAVAPPAAVAMQLAGVT